MKTYKIYLHKVDLRKDSDHYEHIETLFIEDTDMTVESLRVNLIRPLLISAGIKFRAYVYEVPRINGKEREFGEFGNSPEKLVDTVCY